MFPMADSSWQLFIGTNPAQCFGQRDFVLPATHAMEKASAGKGSSTARVRKAMNLKIAHNVSEIIMEFFEMFGRCASASRVQKVRAICATGVENASMMHKHHEIPQYFWWLGMAHVVVMRP